MLNSLINRAASRSSRWTGRGGLALVLATAAMLATPAVHAASAASCKEGAQTSVFSTVPNPNGPGVATQEKVYQCVGGRWLLVITITTSPMRLASPTTSKPTTSGTLPTDSPALIATGSIANLATAP